MFRQPYHHPSIHHHHPPPPPPQVWRTNVLTHLSSSAQKDGVGLWSVDQNAPTLASSQRDTQRSCGPPGLWMVCKHVRLSSGVRLSGHEK